LSALALTALVQPYPFFRPDGELEAMDWLRGHAAPEDVVLAAYWTGSYLPLRSGTRTYLGHYYETIHFQEKQDDVAQFFNGAMGDAARQSLLERGSIDYIFYGRAERELASWNPAPATDLAPVFENSEAVIYRVIR
jgi:hypothetical protein